MSRNFSLKRLVLSGSLWTLLGVGVQQTLRFGGNLILTRLLAPELFGLMALTSSVRIGLELFSDLGLGQNIIHSEKGKEPYFYNTAWTIKVIKGFLLWVFSLVLTIPVANFYQEERILFLLPIIGLTTILDGFSSTSILLLKKDLKLGVITTFNVSSQMLGLLIMIIWASISPSIWALVTGTLSAAGFGAIGTHFVLPGPRNRFFWDQQAFQEIRSFGQWIFLSSILYFLATQADRLILPKLFSFELLGVYTIAYALASLPRLILQRIGGQVIFPAFTKLKSLPRSELKEKIYMPRMRFLLIAAAALSLLFAFGDLLITFLYDSRYEQAAWMFPILCLGVWFSMLFSISVNALLAFGKPVYQACAHASTLLIVPPGMYLANELLGIVAVITVISVSDLCAYLGIQYGLYTENMIFPKQDLVITLLFLILALLLSWLRWVLGWGFPLSGLTENF